MMNIQTDTLMQIIPNMMISSIEVTIPNRGKAVTFIHI